MASDDRESGRKEEKKPFFCFPPPSRRVYNRWRLDASARFGEPETLRG